MRFTRNVLPLMKDVGSGSIIFISSIAAKMTNGGMEDYHGMLQKKLCENNFNSGCDVIIYSKQVGFEWFCRFIIWRCSWTWPQSITSYARFCEHQHGSSSKIGCEEIDSTRRYCKYSLVCCKVPRKCVPSRNCIETTKITILEINNKWAIIAWLLFYL